MDKYFEVMQRIIDLLETMEQGLIHVEVKIKEGNFNDTLLMFNDLVAGFSTIESAIKPILPHLSDNNINDYSNKLRLAFDKMVSCYENNQPTKALETIQLDLIPKFSNWYQEILRLLKPYVLS